MSAQLKKWLPLALCCLPGVAIAAIAGIGIAIGGSVFGVSFGGPLGLALIVLATLACPLSMGLMMRRGSNQKSAPGGSRMRANCCLPGDTPAASEADSAAERLAALRERRQALERALAELRQAR